MQGASETLYEVIKPIDQQSDDNAYDLVAENSATGIPYQYDKTANGIFFDPIPSYSATNGLKIYINREPSYFVSGDTTKKPGCPGIHHRYFALKPALDYARRNSLANYNLIREEVVSFEGDEEKGVVGSIQRYFAKRSRDEDYKLTNKPISYR